MQISNVLSSHNIYQPDRKKQLGSQMGEFSNAVTKSEKGESEGEFLGLTMLPEEGKTMVYGMRAMLSKESTADKPIVQVISNLDGNKEVFDIDINSIDPENASRMEMFALCSYADKYGMGTGSTFGSFQTFRIYEEEAKQNGCMRQIDMGISTWEQFRTEKINWVKVNEDVLNILKTYNDPKVMDLFAKGKKCSSCIQNM